MSKRSTLYSLIGFATILIFAPMMCVHWSKAPLSTEESAFSISRQVRYSFTIQNTTGSLVENAGLHTYAPLLLTPFQQCQAIQASHPYTESVDTAGNRVLSFSLGNVAPYAAITVSVTADLLMADHPVKNADTDNRQYLQPEQFIESGHADIAAMASDLRSPNDMATVRNIFDQTTGYLTYTGYHGSRHGALLAYKNKTGDCTEFMDLFVALCRANAIPARGIGGYICPANMVLRPQGYHNWAEFYTGENWQLADPQKKVFRQNAADYVAMRIITPSAPFEKFQVVGDGLTVKMN